MIFSMSFLNKKFIRIAFIVIIVLWITALWLTGADKAPDTIEKQFGLKAGPGRELVLANCLPCHSTAIVAANHLSRKRWNELITQMQTKNGMRTIESVTQTKILNYLETAQRPEDPGLNAGKESPWATPLYRPNPLWE